MNPFEMVVIIVAIVTLGSIIRARHGGGRFGRRFEVEQVDDAEKQMLREEVQELKERVAVLERIATDRGTHLADEIERLRDR